MGLVLHSLIVSMLVLSLTDTCIPTKTPEPGIPVNPTNPNKCPAMPKYPDADCNTANNPMGYTCAEATVTPTSVSCTITGSILYVVGPGGTPGFVDAPLTCKGSDWTLPDDSTLFEFMFVREGQVACMSM